MSEYSIGVNLFTQSVIECVYKFVGDVVFVYDNNAPALGISVVLSNTGSVVDIADGTAITVTDSD